MARPIPLVGGRKILPTREDLERQPFSAFAVKRIGRPKGSGFTISGYVTDGADPINGVTVTLSGDADDVAVTNEEGYYEFTGLSAGEYTITPSLEDYEFEPSEIDDEFDESEELDDFVGTYYGWSISGTILDGASAPVSGVTVTLSGDAADSTTTDGSGNYTFSGLANGSYTVTPSLAPYEFSPASDNPLVSGGSVTGIDFTAILLQTLDTYIGFEAATVPAVDPNWNNPKSATWATMAIQADSQSYTPSQFTKAARANLTGNGIMLSYDLDRLPASGKVRIACLFRVGTGTYMQGRYGLGVDEIDSEFDFAFGYIDENTNPDGQAVGAYNSGALTNGDTNNTGQNMTATEWRWCRVEIDIDASIIYVQHYKHTGPVTGTQRSATFAACGGWTYARDGMKLIIFNPDRAGLSDAQWAGFWIGDGNDSWPT